MYIIFVSVSLICIILNSFIRTDSGLFYCTNNGHEVIIKLRGVYQSARRPRPHHRHPHSTIPKSNVVGNTVIHCNYLHSFYTKGTHEKIVVSPRGFEGQLHINVDELTFSVSIFTQTY